MGSKELIALGVVYNAARDKVLIARRPRRSHLGGLWEFPGGRVRSGESVRQALKRELFEEVNIDIRECSPLLSFDYDYPGKPLQFSVWKVHGWAGQWLGKEGQETRWADISSLAPADFPAANKGIIAACKLPAVYLITPNLENYTLAFLSELQKYVAAGIKLVQYRNKKSNHHRAAVTGMIDACRNPGAQLIVNSTPEFAMEVGASGVHLTSKRLLQLTARPLPAGYWVAASCHNMHELKHAVNSGVDFCVLSRVRKKKRSDSSASGEQGQPSDVPENILGWAGFSDLVKQIPLPVYALGGMKLSDLTIARQHGAQGIALVSDVWNGPDSAARIARLPPAAAGSH